MITAIGFYHLSKTNLIAENEQYKPVYFRLIILKVKSTKALFLHLLLSFLISLSRSTISLLLLFSLLNPASIVNKLPNNMINPTKIITSIKTPHFQNTLSFDIQSYNGKILLYYFITNKKAQIN
jgi:hypothetical protein